LEGWFGLLDLLWSSPFAFNHDDGWNYLHLDGHANFGNKSTLQPT